MAHNMRTLWGSSKGVINTLFRNTVFNASNGRYMYTPAALKIVEYERERHLARAQYMGVEETFRGKMNNICRTSTGKIYMEDLKAMLYLAQKDDMPLLVKMIEMYNQNDNHKFVFGPVIMRTLYFVDDPETALQLYNKPELSNLFNKHSARTILLTLLYDHAMYDAVIDIWKRLESENEGSIGSKSTRTILFASLAKKGTSDALEMATSVWQQLTDMKVFGNRELNFYLYLLLQNQKPEVVLTELAESTSRGVCHTHFKLLALLELGKYDEACEVLNNVILETETKPLIFRDLGRRISAIPDDIEAKHKIQNALYSIPRQNTSQLRVEQFIFMPMRSIAGNLRNRQPEDSSFRERLLSKSI